MAVLSAILALLTLLARLVTLFPFFDEALNIRHFWLTASGLKPETDFFCVYPAPGYFPSADAAVFAEGEAAFEELCRLVCEQAPVSGLPRTSSRTTGSQATHRGVLRTGSCRRSSSPHRGRPRRDHRGYCHDPGAHPAAPLVVRVDLRDRALPGTAVREQMDSRCLIDPDASWEDCEMFGAVPRWHSQNVDAGELVRLQRSLTRCIYLRPSRIARTKSQFMPVLHVVSVQN